MKGLCAQDIHDKLVAVLGPDAIDSSMVTKYLRQSQIPPSPLETPEKPPATVTDDAILHALEP
jgi:hypothetical protein